jgi:hypothetical protein
MKILYFLRTFQPCIILFFGFRSAHHTKSFYDKRGLVFSAFLISLFLLISTAASWGQSATVSLRPSHIDLSSTTTESAVLITSSSYSSNDARYRIFNGSNQYNCWNGSAYVTSTSYASGPQIPGTPSSSSTWWVLFQRGNNISATASYRDRLGATYGSNYQTAALTAATGFNSSYYTLSGTVTACTTPSYPLSLKYVVLAFDATTGGNLVVASSTSLTSGNFAITVPNSQTIRRVEFRTISNSILTSVTGTWSSTTNIGTTISLCGATIDPTIALSNNGTQIVAGDVLQGATSHILSTFQLEVTDADATLEEALFTTSGDYVAADIDAFKLWYTTGSSFIGPTQLGSNFTSTSTGSGDLLEFSSLSFDIDEDDIYYFWITADIDAAATIDNIIIVDEIDPTGFTFTDGDATGSADEAGEQTIVAPSTPTLSTDALTGFGSQCIGSSYGPNSFTITGAALTTANVTVASLSGYTFSTTSGGTYTASLNLTQPGGAYSQEIFVRFNPIAATSYDGNIVVGGGGASSIDVAATGSGINGTVGVTTVTATSIGTTSASSGGNSVSTSCGTITNKGVVWGLSANPTVPSANSTDDGTGTSNYSSSITGLTQNTTYNYRAYATNSNGVTSYGSNLTFTTLKDEPTNYPTVFACGTTTSSSIPLSWTAATGAVLPDGYLIKWSSSSYGAISDPVDGTAEANGATTQNESGTSYNVTGLSSGITYYFKIWSYTNSGSNINYKLVSEPQTSCATLTGPCLSDTYSATWGNWTGGSGTYNNSGAGYSGDGIGFNSTSDDIITASTLTNASNITFYAAASSGTANYTIQIQYGTSSSGPWTVAASLSANGSNTGDVTTTFQPFDLPLGLSGAHYLRILMSARSGGSFYLDNVDVYCGSPTPEIEVQGNSAEIVNGDVTPSLADHTDFGSTAVAGGTVNRIFTIFNNGGSDLTLLDSPDYVSISGAHAGDFSLTLNPSSPIVSLDNTSFEITFDPSAVGVRTATITIENDDPDEDPYEFDIQGTGTNSNTSDIIESSGFTYTSNVEYINFQAAGPLTNATGSIGAFRFEVRDGGGSIDADALETELNSITFSVGTTHVNYIRTAALFDGTAMRNNSPSIDYVAGTITFSGLSGSNFTAPDNGSLTLTLRVSFLTTVTDNEQLQFTITAASANTAGSVFATGDAGGAVSSVTGNRNRIEVIADRIAFVTQPNTTTINGTMSPSPSVTANDVYNNRDLDYTTNISITSSGTMTGDPISSAAVSGVATFTSVVHTIEGVDLELTASSGAFSTVISNEFDITNIVYVDGDYRTTGSGTWLSNNASPAIWERLVSGTWTIHNSPSYNTTNNVYIENGHTITTGGSYGSSIKLVIMDGGIFNVNHSGTNGSTYIYASGTLNINASFTMASGGDFEVENNGNVNIDFRYGTPSSSIWQGTEIFHPESNFTFLDWDGANDILIPDNTSISTNTYNGYSAAFGNIIIDLEGNFGASDDWVLLASGVNINLAHNDLIFRTNETPGADIRISTTGTVTSGIGGDFIVEDSYVAISGANFINFKTSGTITFDIFGDMSLDAGTTRIGAGTNPNSTINIHGNLDILTSAFLDMQSTIAGTSFQTINLYGDLYAVGSGRLSCTNIGASGVNVPNNNFNFVGIGDGLTAATTQTIDIASTSSAENSGISFNVKADAYVQLINRNFELGQNSKLTVENDGTMDFGFTGTTALLVNISGAQTGTAFQSNQGSTLKITSPDGISTTGNIGNVQVVASNRSFDQVATFHYIGKVNQVTGNGITTGSSAKIIICDLIDNSTQLSFTNSTGITNPTTISATGGKLDIRKGQVIESTTAYITGSTGTLYMEAGTLYQIAKGSSNATDAGNDLIPRVVGGTFAYILNGGTIELAGSGASNAFQTLRGSLSRPNYINVKYSGANTYNTDYKNLSSQTVIDSALIISGTSVVDCIGLAGTPQSFVGNGALIMSDNSRIRFKNVTTTQPELNGNNRDYSLTGGTVEFYGTTATQQQQLRGNFRTAPSTPVKINYYNIDINADAANLQTFATQPNSSQLGGVGNVDVNSSFLLTGTLNVNAPAVLRMDQNDFIDNGTGTSQVINIFSGAGLLYANQYGIKTSGTGVNDGNIRTSGVRNFSTTANYGFVSSGNMVSGNGLPANVAGLYIYKTFGNNGVTLNNGGTTVNGILGLQSGKIISSETNKLTLAVVSTSDIKSPANVGGVQDMGTDSSYVVGVMGHLSNSTGQMIFPIGSYPVYGPIALTPQGTTAQTYTCDYISESFGNQLLDPANSPQIDHVSYVEYWNVSSTASGTSDDARVKLFWREHSIVGPPANWPELRVVHFDGIDWNTEGNSPTTSGISTAWGSVETNIYVPNFSPITLSTTTSLNPLPVELISFTATSKCPDIVLNWATATELNNDYFAIQHSLDGIHFETIAFVDGNGTTNQYQTYEYVHTIVDPTVNFYRLMQVDFDGTTDYSAIINAVCGEGINSLGLLNTLANNELILQFQSSKNQDGSLVIYGSNGQVVKRQTLNMQEGSTQIRLDISNLPSAMYIVQWNNGNEFLEQKFIKQ